MCRNNEKTYSSQIPSWEGCSRRGRGGFIHNNVNITVNDNFPKPTPSATQPWSFQRKLLRSVSQRHPSQEGICELIQHSKSSNPQKPLQKCLSCFPGFFRVKLYANNIILLHRRTKPHRLLSHMLRYAKFEILSPLR